MAVGPGEMARHGSEYRRYIFLAAVFIRIADNTRQMMAPLFLDNQWPATVTMADMCLALRMDRAELGIDQVAPVFAALPGGDGLERDSAQLPLRSLTGAPTEGLNRRTGIVMPEAFRVVRPRRVQRGARRWFFQGQHRKIMVHGAPVKIRMRGNGLHRMPACVATIPVAPAKTDFGCVRAAYMAPAIAHAVRRGQDLVRRDQCATAYRHGFAGTDCVNPGHPLLFGGRNATPGLCTGEKEDECQQMVRPHCRLRVAGNYNRFSACTTTEPSKQ